MLALEAPDLARRERTWERQVAHDGNRIRMLATGPEPADRKIAVRRAITRWSDKSRSNMWKRLSSLDYGPIVDSGRTPTMLTWTLPGDWLTVAPDGRRWKELVKIMRKRYERAWGEPLIGPWKNEYQRRHAPHFAIWTARPEGVAGQYREVRYAAELAAWEASGRRGRKPYHRPAQVGDGLAFREWQKVVWADVVDHPDPEERRNHELAGANDDVVEGLRCIDPRRLVVYFAKHGSFAAKEYQNRPPPEWQEPGKGPGRYWGYWGLDAAVEAVELAPAEQITLARTIRRYYRAQGVTREVRVPRARGGRAWSAYPDVRGLSGVLLLDAHRVRKRRVRRPVRRMRGIAGFVVANDAPALALALTRAIRQE
jgi:hypothetical protein